MRRPSWCASFFLPSAAFQRGSSSNNTWWRRYYIVVVFVGDGWSSQAQRHTQERSVPLCIECQIDFSFHPVALCVPPQRLHLIFILLSDDCAQYIKSKHNFMHEVFVFGCGFHLHQEEPQDITISFLTFILSQWWLHFWMPILCINFNEIQGWHLKTCASSYNSFAYTMGLFLASESIHEKREMEAKMF